MPCPSPSRELSGLPIAISAYLLWGLTPVYLRFVRDVPAVEFVGWRILFTLPLCLAIVALRKQGGELRRALATRKIALALVASGSIVGTNWLIYIVAVLNGHVFAASLGYYINPLLNVLVGTAMLGERLGRRQWIAVGLATCGVALLAWGAREMLLYSLAIGATFALYGLIRKLVPVGSLPGLTVETLVLAPAAIGIVIWAAAGAGGSSFGKDVPSSLLIAFSGPMTAMPLLLFALAARRMTFSALGFVQFLAPTMMFLEGLLLFGEPLRPVQLACFTLIWCAIAVFAWDILRQRWAAPSAAQAPG
jgi:chloramphenicol-sensitive protein RarD